MSESINQTSSSFFNKVSLPRVLESMPSSSKITGVALAALTIYGYSVGFIPVGIALGVFGLGVLGYGLYYYNGVEEESTSSKSWQVASEILKQEGQDTNSQNREELTVYLLSEISTLVLEYAAKTPLELWNSGIRSEVATLAAVQEMRSKPKTLTRVLQNGRRIKLPNTKVIAEAEIIYEAVCLNEMESCYDMQVIRLE